MRPEMGTLTVKAAKLTINDPNAPLVAGDKPKVIPEEMVAASKLKLTALAVFMTVASVASSVSQIIPSFPLLFSTYIETGPLVIEEIVNLTVVSEATFNVSAVT
jgi:hypothetical protein